MQQREGEAEPVGRGARPLEGLPLVRHPAHAEQTRPHQGAGQQASKRPAQQYPPTEVKKNYNDITYSTCGLKSTLSRSQLLP